MILSYVQNYEDAEEITQDTLVSALLTIKNFRQESAFKTWVYSIAVNKCKDFLKYKSRLKRKAFLSPLTGNEILKRPEKPAPFFHPGVKLESKEQMKILYDSIDQLKGNQKAVIVLSKIEEMSQKEIGQILDISPKAVESLVTRAKVNLKKILIQQGIKI